MRRLLASSRFASALAALLVPAVLTRCRLVLAATMAVLVLADPAWADATSFYDVSNSFSGPNEVWAGLYPIDVTITYSETQIGTTAPPGRVHAYDVSFTVTDPTGHVSSAVSLTYQYFTQTPPVPIKDFGVLDPASGNFHVLIVTAAANARPGTWHIQPHLNRFTWDVGGGAGIDPNPGQTITLAEEPFALTVHAAPTTTTPAAVPHNGGGQPPAVTTPSAPTTAPDPTTTATEPPATPQASGSASPAITAAQPGSNGLALPWYLLIGAGSAAGFGGLAMLVRRLVRPKRTV
jgi:hypothetical protein